MNEHVCARCAAIYPTCCRMDPADAALCFPLSPTEEARLAPYAQAEGLPSSMPEDTSREFQNNLRYLFPGKYKRIRSLFPVPGEHRRLPTSPEGHCLFLATEGCLLPREARPWYCLLFPLWFRNSELDLFAAYQCLIAKEAPKPKRAMELLGMKEEQARKLYDALCQEWGIHE